MNNRLLNYKKACILSIKYVNADADFSTGLDLLHDHTLGLLKLSLFTRKELKEVEKINDTLRKWWIV